MGRAFEYRKAAKEKRWGKMSRLFPRLAKAITMAAKESGIDPSTNSSLRTAIQNAKAQNMPKDNIDKAINRATASDVENYTEISYEGKGPHGVLVMVECATDNSVRTVANVRSYFNKAGGGVVPNGSLEFMFDRKAVFELDLNPDLDTDSLELELIDAGLQEIDSDDEALYLYADWTNFGNMQKALEEMTIEPKKATLQRFATTPVEFSEEQQADIDKMLEKIDDDDDVQAVYTNVE